MSRIEGDSTVGDVDVRLNPGTRYAHVRPPVHPNVHTQLPTGVPEDGTVAERAGRVRFPSQIRKYLIPERIYLPHDMHLLSSDLINICHFNYLQQRGLRNAIWSVHVVYNCFYVRVAIFSLGLELKS